MIEHGDCMELLDTLDDASVHAIITDPPYHLVSLPTGDGKYFCPKTRMNKPVDKLKKVGFMGKAWDGGDIAFRPDVWEKCLRVMKPGGYLLAFGGTRTYHRLACAIEDAGFVMRDCIQWIYGEGFPKSLNIGKAVDATYGKTGKVVGQRAHSNKGMRGIDDRTAVGAGSFGKARVADVTEPETEAGQRWKGWGTALKPAVELIAMAHKPKSGSYAENTLEHGVGGLNIDACRVPYGGEKPNVGGRGAHGRGDGYGFKPLGDEAQPNEDGRWPANVVHDGSDAVLSQFPEVTGSTSTQQGGGTGGIWHDGNGVPVSRSYGDGSGSAARFFYCAKPGKAEREAGLSGLSGMTASEVTGRKEGSAGLQMVNPDGSPKSNAYASASYLGERRNVHPTVKPLALMRWLVRLVCPPDGVVLDPFAGSGTTGCACALEGMQFIGFEAEEAYVNIAQARFNYHNKQRRLL